MSEPHGSSSEQFWDGHYRRHADTGDVRPNPVLAEVAGPLAPGTALDLGCGQGSDAIWLAARGWRVTAVDVSPTALARAAVRATAAGASEINWQRHDLASSFPVGMFDLVSTQYLHSPVDFPREQVLRSAARAVAPGGLLLVVGHREVPPWAQPEPGHQVDLPAPDEVVASLALPAGQWRTVRADLSTRKGRGPAGDEVDFVDCVVAVARLGPA